MTDRQRKQISELRNLNKGYSEIASVTGLSRDSVKVYCRNHNLGGIRKGNVGSLQGYMQTAGLQEQLQTEADLRI